MVKIRLLFVRGSCSGVVLLDGQSLLRETRSAPQNEVTCRFLHEVSLLRKQMSWYRDTTDLHLAPGHPVTDQQLVCHTRSQTALEQRSPKWGAWK